MLSFREIIAIGTGMRTDPDLFVARKALTWRERRRAAAAVRRGETAWDAPSARYAAALARSQMRVPMLYGKRGTHVVFSLMTLLFIAYAIESVVSSDWRRASYFVPFAIWFSYVAVRFPAMVRNAPAAYERNRAMMGDADRLPPAEFEVSRGTTALCIVAAGIYIGVFWVGASLWLGWQDDSGLGGLAIQGAIFGILFALIQRFARRRKERAEERERGGTPQAARAVFHEPSRPA